LQSDFRAGVPYEFLKCTHKRNRKQVAEWYNAAFMLTTGKKKIMTFPLYLSKHPFFFFVFGIKVMWKFGSTHSYSRLCGSFQYPCRFPSGDSRVWQKSVRASRAFLEALGGKSLPLLRIEPDSSLLQSVLRS
jgi:hypothetical protein